MTKKLEPLTYCCPNCETVQKHHTWNDSVKDTQHLCIHGGCGTMLMAKDIIVPKKKQLVGIRTPTKNRV